MDKLSLMAFYQFGAQLDSLKHLQIGDSVESVDSVKIFKVLQGAESWFVTFLQETERVPFRKSREIARDIGKRLGPLGTTMLEAFMANKMPRNVSTGLRHRPIEFSVAPGLSPTPRLSASAG